MLKKGNMLLYICQKDVVTGAPLLLLLLWMWLITGWYVDWIYRLYAWWLAFLHDGAEAGSPLEDIGQETYWKEL